MLTGMKMITPPLMQCFPGGNKMAQKDYVKAPYGFGGLGPLDQWIEHLWDSAVYVGRNYRSVKIVNGGDLNERETGEMYFSLRPDDLPETCDPRCGEVESLGPGDTATFRATANIKLWLRWTSPDMAISVQEFYPS